MKKLISMTAAAAVLVMAGSAFAAATSTSLTTSATVTAVCKATAGASIAFGTLDPVNDPATKNATTKGTVQVQCTEGTAYTFAYDAAAKMQVGGAGVAIPIYPVADLVPVAGTVAGTTYNVDAQVKVADYANAPAGAYTGTYTLTVNY